MHRILRVLALAATLALTGCANQRTFIAATAAGDTRVRIEGMSLFDPAGGFTQSAVCAINGKSLDSCETKVELAPGRYELELRLWGIHRPMPIRLVVECEFAQPGTHLLGALVSSRGVMPWIAECKEKSSPLP